MRRTLVNAFVVPVLMCGSFAATNAISQASNTVNAIEQPSEPLTPYESALARMVAGHQCWVGLAPVTMASKTPGHVIVTRRGADRPTYGGPHLVDQALDQVFDHVDNGLVVHAFCR